MSSNQMLSNAFSWDELEKLVPNELDRIEGPNNPYSLLRLFNQPEKEVRVTLYRDHHAWCPYCQKVWLWLELKKIPYKIKKVTMRCYGEKERWYLKKVPSGMLPALEIDNRLITESDQILLALENVFGPLGTPLQDDRSLELRNLERKLFQAWCMWLCYPTITTRQENRKKEQFQEIARGMEKHLLKNEMRWLAPVIDNSKIPLPGSIDVIFIPYVERMNASLAYYKGFSLREEHPAIDEWFKALESLEVYRGTQGDFHTHAHDLPPQMGGCWVKTNPKQKQFQVAIDSGHGLEGMEIGISPDNQSEVNRSESIALSRVFKHRHTLMNVNPLEEKSFDQPLRAALTTMVKGQPCTPTKGTAMGLRYLRDRISVPRDMPLLAARKFRQALEITANLDASTQGPPINTRNRFDQDPKPFLLTKV